MTWQLEKLHKRHHREHFDCGEVELNDYLKRYASQDMKRNIGRTFVAVSLNSLDVLGFYSLSMGSIEFHELPQARKLPKYPIPVARLTRLGVDKSAQGKGLGEYLLMAALKRCYDISQEIAMFGVVVDAKHEKAKKFYIKYGFEALTARPLTLFVTCSYIEQLISQT